MAEKEEEEEEAAEKLAVRLWAKGRRVAAAVTAAHFPILFVGPFLSSEWSLTSTLQVLLGIGASKNPSLFPFRSELDLPYARSVVYNIDYHIHWFHFPLVTRKKNLVQKRVQCTTDFLKRYSISSICITGFLLFDGCTVKEDQCRWIRTIFFFFLSYIRVLQSVVGWNVN